MRTRYGVAVLACWVFLGVSSDAHAFGVSAAFDGGGAYPMVSGSSATPPISPKLGVQVGALVNGKTGFGGLFLDRYPVQNTWNIGFLFKQYFGPSRIGWFHIKVDALTYFLLATQSSGTTVTGAWYNLIGAGAAVGLRLFTASNIGLEPYIAFDTFISPTSIATATLQRYLIPSAGVKVVLELGGK